MTAFFISIAASPAADQSADSHALAGYEIIRLGRGHNNRLDFAATIDGVKGLVVVDTGASTTVLSAGKYGFLLRNGAVKPANVPATVPVNGMRAPVGIARDVQLGSVHHANVAFPLLPQRYLYDRLDIAASDRQYDGYLGENILRGYNAVLDCGRLALYLNTDPRRKLDLGNALTRSGWTQIPMTNSGSNFTVPCTLAGHSYRLLVDTGAPFTVLDSSELQAKSIPQADLPMHGSVMGFLPARQYLVKADTLQIGGYVASGVHLVSNEGLHRAFISYKTAADLPPIVGLLGGDILGTNGAMIDIGNHNLYLKHPGGSAAR